MSDIKECFVSRWGEDGVIMEADYSQIEVVVQAFLSNDLQMKKDVRDGIDFHCKRLAYVEDKDYMFVWHMCHTTKDPMWIAKRKDIKTFSFQRAYGAGAKAIAAATGMSMDRVLALISAEEEMYPEVKNTQDRWIEEVADSGKPTTLVSKNGIPIRRGVLISPITKKEYVFYEDDKPFKVRRGRSVGFSPTKIKNYPIQGFAGEILQLALGKLYRRLVANDNLRKKCLLINTVHDSVLLDVHKSVLEEAYHVVKNTLEDAPRFIKEQYGVEFDLPTPVDIEVGSNWKSKKAYRPGDII